MNKPKTLFICPPNTIEVYGKKKDVVPRIPYISLASLAGSLIRANYDVHIVDLSVIDDIDKELKEKIEIFKPDYIGITFTTPLSKQAFKLAESIKKFSPASILMGGGVHATTLPHETLKSSVFDLIFIGEAEETILEVVSGRDWKEIAGIAYKKDGEIFINPRRPLICDLDTLPFPAWHLYDLPKYKTARICTRKSRVGAIETSRGCVFGCNYCNKTVFQRLFRAKSPERVVDELEYMLKFGFEEIHFWDDGFSTDLDRAKEICRLIVKRKLNFPWNVFNGMRVDRLDKELLVLMKQAGCYGLSIGVESGNQEILNIVNKIITLNQVRQAVKLIKEVGLDITGFFILGLDGETEKTMQDTINFAKELDLDFPKAMITVPLPGTPLFEKWNTGGYIRSYNWEEYVFHPEGGTVYNHPNLKFEVIKKYYDKFYRELYLTPHYVWKRLKMGIRTGGIFQDFYYFCKVLIKGGFI